ncbi:hypothetical protein [Thermoactinomyces sp. DSM 45892]|uniref:hypothetical protein n=1 Tax=Thermoactinomyces sp. DSM 45892 TaxID=1882753 RepID=UPI00089ADD78|nr:hypothetical protein [Thermoactinomyces sp. DSM 45892]SDZ16686.1 hypothetical protein SAMN05444416_11523 [Thermoactinomyces sp. DSM 45892]
MPDVMGPFAPRARRKSLKSNENMKKLIQVFIPFLVLGFILYILIDFRQVETLPSEEKKAIERYRQELVKGTLLNKDTGIFYKKDFDILATSLDRLHQHANYVVFGPEWGYQISNTKEEFAKINSVLDKPEYLSNTSSKDLIKAIKADLSIAQKKYESRESHDILDDLSTLVFIEQIVEDRQWSKSQTISLIKQQGLKLVARDEPKPTSNTSTSTQ